MLKAKVRTLNTIAELKARSRENAVLVRSDGVGLRVVTLDDGGDAALIATCSRWRAAAAEGFPNRFEVTCEGTQRWLSEQVLKADDRILLLVLDCNDRPVGHLGLMHIGNEPGRAVVDGVIRGEATPEQPGLMTVAMGMLITWTFEYLELTALDLYVLCDNIKALRLYAATGFGPTALIPLGRRDIEERTDWVPTEHPQIADRFFLKMERRPSA